MVEVLLSWAEFAAACQAYLEHHRGSAAGTSALGPAAYSQGWSWIEPERPYQAPVGYLNRSFTVTKLGTHEATEGGDDDLLAADLSVGSYAAAEDEATARHDELDSLTIEQSICYSSTWKVPVLYLSASRNGHTLSPQEVLMSAAIVQEPSQLHALDAGDSGAAAWPQLSQGDHPVTGMPSIFLHPCETATRLQEIMQCGDDSNERARLVLEAFMAIASSTVQMRPQ